MTSSTEVSQAWDSFIRWLQGLSPADRAAVLAHPGDALESCGLGNVSGPQLQEAIHDSASYASAVHHGGGGGDVDPRPHPGETPHEAAERVMHSIVNNVYNVSETNVNGPNFGDITTVGGEGNAVGADATGGTVVHGDGNVLGDGNATGDHSVAVGADASVGGNVNSGDHAMVGDESAFGNESVAGNHNAGGLGNTNVTGDHAVMGHDNQVVADHSVGSFGSGSAVGGSVDASHGGAVGLGGGGGEVIGGSDSSFHDSHDNIDDSTGHNSDSHNTDSHNVNVDRHDVHTQDSHDVDRHDQHNPDVHTDVDASIV